MPELKFTSSVSQVNNAGSLSSPQSVLASLSDFIHSFIQHNGSSCVMVGAGPGDMEMGLLGSFYSLLLCGRVPSRLSEEPPSFPGPLSPSWAFSDLQGRSSSPHLLFQGPLQPPPSSLFPFSAPGCRPAFFQLLKENGLLSPLLRARPNLLLYLCAERQILRGPEGGAWQL